MITRWKGKDFMWLTELIKENCTDDQRIQFQKAMRGERKDYLIYGIIIGSIVTSIVFILIRN